VTIPAINPNNGAPLEPSQLYKAKDGIFALASDFPADPTRPLAGVIIDNAPLVDVGYSGHGNVLSGNTVGVLIGGTGSNYDVVAGNIIGLDQQTLEAIPDAIGVYINGSVGSDTTGSASDKVLNLSGIMSDFSDWVGSNVISGNTWAGVELSGPGAAWNEIVGNRIGTNQSGTRSFPNWVGVYVLDAPNNAIGGAQAGARNEISGNTVAGIYIAGSGSTDNVVWNNAVGTTLSGKPGPGSQQYGVLVYGSPGNIIGTQQGPSIPSPASVGSNFYFTNMFALQVYAFKIKGKSFVRNNGIEDNKIANLRTIPGPVAGTDRTIADLPPNPKSISLSRPDAAARSPHPTAPQSLSSSAMRRPQPGYRRASDRRFKSK